MKELVSYIVKSLVQNPDQVRVEEKEEPGFLRVHLVVAEADKGRIIGKQGKVIKAIRSLLHAAGTRTHQRVGLDLE